MRKIILFLLSACLVHISIQAAIFEDLDPHGLVKCQFSSVYQNRIAVDGQRIKKVILTSEGLSVTLEEESGQIFVYALSYKPDATTLSLITDLGTVQDVEISFVEKPSEVLIFKRKDDKPKPVENIQCRAFSFEEESIVKNVTAIIRGKSPAGYHSCQLSNYKKFNLDRWISLEPSGKFVRGGDSIQVWKVKNESKRFLKLSEKCLNFSGAKWVYLHQDFLKPNGTTFILLGGV